MMLDDIVIFEQEDKVRVNSTCPVSKTGVLSIMLPERYDVRLGVSRRLIAQ